MSYATKATEMAQIARGAASILGQAGTAAKNQALLNAADSLMRRKQTILTANAKDLLAGKKAGLTSAMLDRLAIGRNGIVKMAQGLAQIAALPDPVGETMKGWRRPNGLYIRKVRVPIGVIFMIFESRPNVTIDAGGLIVKSGNAAILRGGKEAINSNRALGRVLQAALASAGLPKEAVQVVATPSRALAAELMKQDDKIDVIIPRGGKDLIRAIMEESRIPVIAHLDGVCHVYVDNAADLEMATEIAFNAKVQRPGVCNAMETLLVHKQVAKAFLPVILKKLRRAGVELRGCAATRKAADGVKVKPATQEDWKTEYLDKILSIKVVADLDEAIQHINHYGSQHTDAIVTADIAAAERFRQEVESASVMVNASTRFSDGFEYGMGAEIGISTNKLHVRGPMGLEELTTYKFLVDGDGQVRG
ncbi:MAG: glutamate-5-semialdehyde dehydrogenase [Planctomycetes bacterium]|nr:glutamate-5-semialdehyde dehydrogenase [Planctomycetota bacterium]